ncbi:exodeoxyribonuclease VII small subunit [Actinotalea sp. M2MS4P-6]|uniref:exodeoxyribonuclease VII small subunit n=1 Tax=Actinotalea sp. M2MS4P-6 TaxID=2983762 RepID=UPI0021E39E71|nr:exodeoxyribonuclease VII small subunit [Actinotalea sp. M2MS4P-6]MCV2396399.1 exodeoxyribonuclease VII small subunit [Actinotalea sp. M2MS4P-6]
MTNEVPRAARFTRSVVELPADVAEMTYEQARDELVTVVQRLEAGDQTLEGSLELWERGEALAARCQEWLDGARARLEAARSGQPGAESSSRADDGADPEEP